MMMTGFDLVDCTRLERMLTLDDTFLQISLTREERAECGRSPQRIGMKWAAKEAVLKALGQGIGKVALLDIAVHHDERGIPQVTLFRSAKTQSDLLGITKIHASLGTTTNMAIAFVLATGDIDA